MAQAEEHPLGIPCCRLWDAVVDRFGGGNTVRRTVLLIGHGGYYNRGCEAIVRTTADLLCEVYPSIRIILASYDRQGDLKRDLRLTDALVQHFAERWTLPWGAAVAGDRFRLVAMRRAIREADVVLSVGGDNYCYADPTVYFYLNRAARDAGVPVVLWGASVETDGASKAKIDDLKSFRLITARESLTVGKLAAVGVESSVRLVADPAFLLPTRQVDTTAYWPEADRVVGINLSPLLARYRNRPEEAGLLQTMEAVVRYLVDDLRLGVLLVPHVTLPMPPRERWNDDHALLVSLAKAVERPRRVTVAPTDLGARETKYVISQCHAFIGARTHSTIASLSEGVPTLSIGYSVKARGINLDVFGHTRFVQDAQTLDVSSLTRALVDLLDAEEEVRGQLQREIPRVKQLARDGAKFLGDLGCL
jgi:colanic acid/amylovoran biosynthesis protein